MSGVSHLCFSWNNKFNGLYKRNNENSKFKKSYYYTQITQSYGTVKTGQYSHALRSITIYFIMVSTLKKYIVYLLYWYILKGSIEATV